MAHDIKKLLARFNPNMPAARSKIKDVENRLGQELPREYHDFLEITDGGEGFVGSGSYVILWTVEELIDLNDAYGVHDFMPGLLIFGSDGGGEAFGFDMRSPQRPIVQVTFVGLDWSEALPFGSDFYEFLEILYGN